MTLIYLMFGVIVVAAFGAAFLLAFRLDLRGTDTGAPKPPTFELLSAPKQD